MSSSTFDRAAKTKQAQTYLRATKGEKEMMLDKDKIQQLAKEFQRHSVFSYARRLFQLLHEHFPKDESITERLAVCTYKDTDLSSDVKYDVAAKLLVANFAVDGEIRNANVLGVLGSIYKKKWQYDNHEGHLYQSLRYYLRGFELGLERGKDGSSDAGYCGINLALVYNLLADLDRFHAQKDIGGFQLKLEHDPLVAIAVQLRNEAKKCREKIRELYSAHFEVFSQDWETAASKEQTATKITQFWYLVTWAEAALGLGEFEEAAEKYQAAMGLGGIPGWMVQATRMQSHDLAEMLFKINAEKLRSAKAAISCLFQKIRMPRNQGIKLGLALSGGGFRASLFHIGVLAKLAEADLLRKVEVISCVSGGSILGAYYYLELKKMLEAKGDEELGKEDFLQLVAKLERDFLVKVNKNVRLNILANGWTNLKMALLGNYTRTSRTAELYDKFLYADVLPKEKTLMQDLLIRPNGDFSFRPDRDNWQRDNKVPILILNATTLNTGHSWQFTATWMGESPAYIDSEFDALPNLRRMYYWEAPEGYREIPLSTAVAASAGVPGLFAPIFFENLYEDYSRVLLVDGGVHDNQGISTLYEQECNLLIISDASGQMLADKEPPGNEFGVFGRTNSILQERIRFSQFRDLEARKQSGLVRDFLLMHLTKGIPSEVVNWKNCDDPYVPPTAVDSPVGGLAVMTDYLIRKNIQTLLARIRTDLDAFHESEAYALMYSGYLMAANEIKLASSPFFKNSDAPAETAAPDSRWNFMAIDKVHGDNTLSRQLEAKLKPSSHLFGKVFGLSKMAKWGAWSVFAIVGAVLLVLLSQRFPETVNLRSFYQVAIPVVVAFVVERMVSKWLRINSVALSLLLLVPGVLVLWAVSQLINWVSTKWYLNVGKLPK